MKNLKLFLVATAAVLLFTAASCEKENEIIYYNNVIGEGWLASKSPFEPSISLMESHLRISLVQQTRKSLGMFDDPISHTDVITTDGNGHFTCRFVKSIRIANTKKRIILFNYYKFTYNGESLGKTYISYLELDAETLKEADEKGTLKEPTIIKLDTLLIPRN